MTCNTRFDIILELVGTPIYYLSLFSDPNIKALLKPYTDKLHALVHEVVGFANDDLLARTCGAQECALGDLTADAFLNAVSAFTLCEIVLL